MPLPMTVCDFLGGCYGSSCAAMAIQASARVKFVFHSPPAEEEKVVKDYCIKYFSIFACCKIVFSTVLAIYNTYDMFVSFVGLIE